jgi:WD40 repeat protein
VQNRIAKKNKTNSSEVMKEPEAYEVRNTYSNIHEEKVGFIDKLSNGNVFSGSMDSTIRIWDPSQGQLFRVFEGHTHAIT